MPRLLGPLPGVLVVGALVVGTMSAPATPGKAALLVPVPAPDPARTAVADKPSQLADPECLTVTRASAATFVIENKLCPDRSVLTAIELAEEGEKARCFTKKIRSQVSLASAGAVPLINYQCIEGAPGCSIEALRGMFPECRGN